MAARTDIVITRVFDAPRALVWKAWTEPERFRQWWGPKGYTSPASTIDLRVGGRYLHCMRGPKGQEIWTAGVYREIVPLERLVYTDGPADANGHVVPASQLGPDWPAETVVTVTFEEHAGKTRLTLRHVGFPAGEMTDMAGAAYEQALDKLAASLTTSAPAAEGTR